MKDFWNEHWRGIVELMFIVVAIVLAVLLYRSCDTANKWERNYEAMCDTVRTEQLKNGELLSSKLSLQLSHDELCKELDLAKEEIRDLEKRVGKVKVITKIVTQVRVDTLTLSDTIWRDSASGITHLRWYYSDQWIGLDGESSIDSMLNTSTRLNSATVDLRIKTGISEEGRIFFVTDNPYVSVQNIEGAEVGKVGAKQKSRWGLSVYGGFGAQYGVLKRSFDIGPQLGVGVTFDIF